jgi:hypothetical protein
VSYPPPFGALVAEGAIVDKVNIREKLGLFADP